MSENRQTSGLRRASMLVMDDFERCYRAVQSRDPRFDGWFFTAVTSTHIYCRPSCPALTPKRENVRFYPTAAAAQQSGFRACLRCWPDAAPGSPEWLGRADVAARAVKLVLHGIIDGEGVPGLARRLGYSERQLHRVLVAEVGTGALALARAQRSQTARTLLETTDLPAADVAFAAGFQSVRQFNETVKQVFGRTPTELRRGANRRTSVTDGPQRSGVGRPQLALRLAHRRPFAAEPLFSFLAARAVPGVEAFEAGVYRRSLRLPHGGGTVELTPADGYVDAVFCLADLRDLSLAVAKCRHLLNLDSDPEAVDDALGADPLLGPLVEQVPGRRVPGATDGLEIALRAIVGQQVSLGSARTIAGALVRASGSPLDQPLGPVTHTFPDAGALADLAVGDPSAFPMPAARRRALQGLAEAVATGKLIIDPGADPAEVENGLLAIPGVGPWTSAYIVMRAIGDPDAFLPTDLGLRRAAALLGQETDAASLIKLAEHWRPWRSYALAHLWSVTSRAEPARPVTAADAAAGENTGPTGASSTLKGKSAA